MILVKAEMLYEDYLVSCTNRGVEPERIDITNKCVNEFLAEYRLSQRCPNRKRWILAERLRIFWIVVHSVRQLILLVFGYDPMMRNIDQSPFHKNEAGSVAQNTIVMTGAPTVPLIENHCATRERCSLNSVTDSSEERIKKATARFRN